MKDYPNADLNLVFIKEVPPDDNDISGLLPCNQLHMALNIWISHRLSSNVFFFLNPITLPLETDHSIKSLSPCQWKLRWVL